MSEIATYTKKMFDPVHPDIQKIDVVDIAHSLSLLCRANGHFPTFYSVGQHCLNCAREAIARGYSRRVQLACLLHDASEAYLSDVTRPVKAELPRYLEIEEPLQRTIWDKYIQPALTEEEIKQVFWVDDEILYKEFATLMGMPLINREPDLQSAPQMEFGGFREIETAYIRMFEELK